MELRLKSGKFNLIIISYLKSSLLIKTLRDISLCRDVQLLDVDRKDADENTADRM